MKIEDPQVPASFIFDALLTSITNDLITTTLRRWGRYAFRGHAPCLWKKARHLITTEELMKQILLWYPEADTSIVNCWVHRGTAIRADPDMVLAEFVRALGADDPKDLQIVLDHARRQKR